MQITNLRINRIYDGEKCTKLVASATIQFDNCFVVRDIKILKNSYFPDRPPYFLAMPYKRFKNGNNMDLAFPNNNEARKALEDVIFPAMNYLLRDPQKKFIEFHLSDHLNHFEAIDPVKLSDFTLSDDNINPSVGDGEHIAFQTD